MADERTRPLTSIEHARYADRALSIIKQLQGTSQLVGFYPTPAPVIEAALDLLDLSAGDHLIDTGCGAGPVLAAAARRGINATGIETDPRLAAMAAGLQNSTGPGTIRVALGSFLKGGTLKMCDVGTTKGVYCFLQSWVLDKLLPELQPRLPVGARVVSYAFLPRLCPWKPIGKRRVPHFEDGRPDTWLYLWQVAPRPQRRIPAAYRKR